MNQKICLICKTKHYSLCIYRLEPDETMTDNTHRQWYIFITQSHTVKVAENIMRRKFVCRKLVGRWNNVPNTQITRNAIYQALNFMHWYYSKHVASIGGTQDMRSVLDITDITDEFIINTIKTVLLKLRKA